jgi:molybdenum cofactor guanylyltransferase
MGRDKASLPFGPETLLDRVLRSAAAVADEVVLAAAPGQQVPAGYRVSRDAGAGLGPLPALIGALPLVHAAHTLVLACDLPLLQPAVLSLLVDLAEGWEGAVPLVNGRRLPTCAVFKTAALRQARERFGDPRHRSLRDFIAGLRLRDVPADRFEAADPRLASFTQCNTPDEYRVALGLAGLDVNGPPPGAV